MAELKEELFSKFCCIKTEASVGETDEHNGKGGCRVKEDDPVSGTGGKKDRRVVLFWIFALGAPDSSCWVQ